MTEKLTEKIYHSVLLVIAIVLIFSAVVFTVTRALTPFLNLHRSTFERWAGKVLDAPVKVSHVSFGWHGIDPEIWLQGVTIYQPKTHKVALHVKDFYAAISLFRSVEHLNILPNLITLSGVKISVRDQGHGVFKINDMTVSSVGGDKTGTLNAALTKAWLLDQSRLYLRNIRINFYNASGKLFPLKVGYINLQSSDQFHQLDGKVVLLNKHKTALHVIIHAHGSMSNARQLQASIYGKLTHVYLASWLQSKKIAGYRVAQGEGKMQYWLSWNKGHWEKAQGRVNLLNLALIPASKKPFKIKYLSSDIGWFPGAKGWRFTLDNVNLMTQDAMWPRFHFSLKKTMNNQSVHWRMGASFLEIRDVQDFLCGSTQLKARWKTWLSRFNPSGEVSNLQVGFDGSFQKPSHFALKTALNHVSFRSWHKIPGIKNASAALAFNPSQGRLTLKTRNAVLNYPSLFKTPLPLGALQGEIRWRRKPDGTWLVHSTSMKASNNDLGLYTQFKLHIFPKKKPLLSLLAGYYVASPLVVKKYLPYSVMSKHLFLWLKQAFVGGKALQGKMILRGHLSDFPFDKNQGVFQIDTKIKDIDLYFAKGWPLIRHINADLLFANRKMVINAHSAMILNSKVPHVTATIPNLNAPGGASLLVDGKVSGHAADMIRFINESPLKKNVGQVFKRLAVHGPVGLALKLDVPLSDTASTRVDGNIHFLNDKAEFANWYVNLEKLNGFLHFGRLSLSSKKLTAMAFGRPIVINMATQKMTPEKHDVYVSFNGAVELSYLKKDMPWLNQINVDGATTYSGSLLFHLGDQAALPNQLTWHSDLFGIALHYPLPVGKRMKTIVPLNVKVTFGNHQNSLLTVNYGHRLASALTFSVVNDTPQFYGGSLQFSQPASFSKYKGLTVGGYIPSVQWAAWQKALMQPGKNTLTPSKAKDWRQALAKILRVMDVHVGRFSAYGINLKPAEFRLSHTSKQWFIAVLSNSVEGMLGIPDDFPNQAMTGKFKKILLPSIKFAANKQLFNPGSVPPMLMTTKALSYNHHAFGAVTLNVQPKEKQLIIKQLKAQSPLLSGDVHGIWQISKQHYQTNLDGWVSSDNIQKLFQTWKIHSSLVGTKGRAKFSLAWPDAPYKLDLKALQGDVNLQLGSGWIVGLSKSLTQKLNLGRLINVLSVRHLMLQMGDISHSGYSFDTLQAKLHFDQGHVTTKDLHIKGSVADIWAKGVINLIARTLDLKLAIVVNATSSLPVIATVATGFNPLVGLATWLVDKAVHKVLTATVNYNYEVLGSWDKPRVKKLKSASSKQ